MYPRGYGVSCSLISSRGCIYRCIYCGSSHFWEKIRFHSPHYVLKEIQFILNKYKDVKDIFIFDDLFPVKKERLKNIVELVEQEGINEKLSFKCQANTDLIDEEILSLLKRMNMHYIGFGLESGSQKILNVIKRRTASVRKNSIILQMCYKRGIKVGSGFMIGSPGEEEDDLRDTYKFILRHPLNSCNVYLTVPLPGTELWQIALKNRKVFLKMDWNKINQFYLGDDLVNLSTMADKRLLKWKKKIEDACVFSMIRANSKSKLLFLIRLLRFVLVHPRRFFIFVYGIYIIINSPKS